MAQHGAAVWSAPQQSTGFMSPANGTPQDVVQPGNATPGKAQQGLLNIDAWRRLAPPRWALRSTV